MFFALEATALTGCNNTIQRQLDVYIWEGYLPKEVAALFEQETAVKLNISLISDNEKMAALLRGGGKADIVMPTNNHINIFYENGLAQPLDLKNIKNYERVSRPLREQPWTKWDGSNMGTGEIFAIPYIFGTSGLIINTTKYTKSLDNIGWDVLLDADLKGRTSTTNSEETLFFLLDLSGIPREDLSTDTVITLNKIRDKVTALKDNVLKFYNTGAEISDLLMNEEVWISHIWDGNGRSLCKSDAKFKYVFPKTGGVAWTDSFIIPKSAANFKDASVFINFMLRPDIAAKVTLASGYNTTIEESLDLIKSINKDFYRFSDEEMVNFKWAQNLSEEERSICVSFWEELTSS